MRKILPSAASRSRSMMMAVVLGTAMTAGEGQATASPPTTPTAAAVSPTAVRDLTRYCQVCWRNARLPADRWEDCTQQVFVRLLERVAPERWSSLLRDDDDNRREFIRAIDAVKKRTQRIRKQSELSVDVADHRNRTDDYQRDHRDAMRQAAVSVLSARQQTIVQLTVDGWTVPDIAIELQTTPERISDEKYKAIRKLRTHLGVEA